MSKLSRTKGRSFEQLVANLYRNKWGVAVVRRSQQAHRAFEPDVVVEGQRLWTECCHGDAVNPIAKLEQAERDVKLAPGEWLPIVVWRKTGARTINATMRLWALNELTDDHGPIQLQLAHEDLVVTLDFAALLAVLP